MRLSQLSALLFAVGVFAAPGSRRSARDVTPDYVGSCGSSSGKSCLDSFLGDCCSKDGFCGNGVTFCGVGCQEGYGKCIPTFDKKLISQDGTCGSSVTCQGSKYGSCCSQFGFCGSSSDYCGAGCDSDHGSCSDSGSFKLKARDSNPTCPSSNNTVYTTDAGNQYQIQCGLDHSGGDLKMVYTNSNKIADCISQCDSTDGCVGISMSGTACYMKSKIGAPAKNSNVRGAVFVGKLSTSSSSSASASATSSSSTVSSSSTASATSSSSTASSTLSSSTESSTSSSSTESSTSSATSSDSSTSSDGTSSSALPTSTAPACPAANNTVYIASSGATFLIECYIDHQGGDLKSVNVPSNRIADCIALCDATDKCVDISMSGTACYMKSKVGKAISNKHVRGARLIKPASTSTSSSASSTSSTSSGILSTSTSSAPSTSSSSSAPSSSSSAASSSSSVASSSSSAASSSSSAASSSSSAASSSSSAASSSSSAASSSSSSVASSSSSVASSSSSAASSSSSSSIPTGSKIVIANSTVSSSFISSSAYLSTGLSSSNVTSSRTETKTNSTVVSSSAFSTISTSSHSIVLSTHASSGIATSTTAGSPYGNGTSTFSTAGPTVPFSSGVSSSSKASSSSGSSANSTGSISSSVVPTAPVSTGVSLSTGVSNSASASTDSNGSPYGNGTSSAFSQPTVSSKSSSSVVLSTGVSSSASASTDSNGSPYGNGTSSAFSQPTASKSSSSVVLSTGVSSSASASTDSNGSPYGNGTSSAFSQPTVSSKSSSSVVLTTGVSSTLSSSNFSATTNSSAALTTSYNITGSISSTVITLISNSSSSIPLSTAPITTGVSSGGYISSSSAGPYSNTSTVANTTVASTTTAPVYPFAYGGIPSGHPVVSNTSACSTKPTSTAACTPCEGQPGDDKFCGYTAYDDSYSVMPITCNTVEYSLDLTECEVAPDGVSRPALCVNGQTPGPLLEANWGDTVIVHVTNSMSVNGSSIHWHGMRQNYTNEMDGVVGITQCALAPGQTQTYTWKATNYGNSWYHSHLTLQAYEGLFGPMLIHGPTTGDYDEDAGQLIIQDWSHIPVDAMYHDAEINGVRTLDTGLINGMNINPAATTNATGQRYTVPTEFVPGKKYLFHILNSGIQSSYKFYVDGHNLTVISTDFVPIVPYSTQVLNINIGQRYQVIVEANQAVGDYFLRFDNQNACASTINSDNIRGIIHYQGSSGGTPNSTAQTYPRKSDGAGGILGFCEDEPLESLVPAAPVNVGSSDQTVSHDVIVSNSNAIQLYRWYLDGTTFQANWADPTLYDIVNNDTVPDYSGDLAIETKLGEWIYIIIESPVPLGHPIHLHGHDFHILARGYGTYDSSVALNLNNPPRRDVAFLPGDGPTGQGGFMVLAFYTDNPGVWLMHCHIGWHVAMGFALQFIEGKELINETVTDTCSLNGVCTDWRSWSDGHGIYTDDSGV